MQTPDDVLKMVIKDLYPDYTEPDKNNIGENGLRFRAPDIGLFGEMVLIELKSRNTKDGQQFYELLQKIAQEQGGGVGGYGRCDIQRLVRLLPDPKRANATITDYFYRQSRKAAREARLKFEVYEVNRPRPGAIRVLIISDCTGIEAANDTEEAFFGRTMGAHDAMQDDLAIIDAVVLIKDPRFVIDRENSYWFKCLVRSRLKFAEYSLLMGVVESIRARMGNYTDYVSAIEKVRLGEYRVLIV